jgi:hypothetical protein
MLLTRHARFFENVVRMSDPLNRQANYFPPSLGEFRWQSAILVLDDVDVAVVVPVVVGRPCVHHLRLRPTKT